MNSEGLIPILKNSKNIDVPSQVDDFDKDGKWDELFFLVDIEPNTTKELTLTLVEKNKIPKYKVRSNIRFSTMEPGKELTSAERLKSAESLITQKHFQMEGPAWENDKVAFRNYFDARNGMDIFGKRTSKMVLDSVGLEAHSYHKIANWGMDVLRVGKSLGAGAIALKKNDSIYRVDLFETGTYELIANGPLRSIFKLGFKGWKVGSDIYNVEHEISIRGGTQFYKSKVTVTGLKGGETLITGIVNKQSDELIISKQNTKYVSLATHDNQAYDGEKMGMALLVKKADYLNTITAPETGDGIVQTYMAELKIENNVPVEFYFYNGWELQDERFKETEYFLNLIKNDADKYLKPILVR